MRFHIPSSELAGDDPIEAFHQQVMKQADVINVSGDAIAIFREIHILTPRFAGACILVHPCDYAQKPLNALLAFLQRKI